MTSEVGRLVFCFMASSLTWHVRPLSDEGWFLHKTADTLSLCGKKVGWDIPARLNLTRYFGNGVCPDCAHAALAPEWRDGIWRDVPEEGRHYVAAEK